MRLAAKLILLFLVGVLGIVGVSAWQTIEQQRLISEERHQIYAAQLVDAITPAIAKAYEEGGVVTVAQVVEFTSQTISGFEMHLLYGKQVPPLTPETTTRKVSSLSVTNSDGTRVTHSFVPLAINGKDVGVVQVSHPLGEHDTFMRTEILRALIALLGVSLFSGAVIYFGGVRLVGQPLKKLMLQCKDIGDGNLDQLPVIATEDELGQLANIISEMSRKLRLQRDAIRHTDRLGTVGTLAAGIAHELGTPLNVVSGQAGLIAGGRLTEGETAESATMIKEEADRMTTIVRQLLDFARQKPVPYSPIRLAEVIRRTMDLMKPLASKANIRVEFQSCDNDILVAGDAAQLQQVFSNLLSNAFAAMPEGGDVNILTTSNTGDENVCIDVTDSGVGIAATDIPLLFEPFFTTKDVGKGTGLGLSIAYGIIREHSGQISVSSQPGSGTTFRIILPVTTTGSLDAR
ncbi:MAG: HAMP domain-containing histidine kinase [Planctomycetales bacterium]|nr:HAMP domain-containing histidine kinase [Planctomycetales bacterium]